MKQVIEVSVVVAVDDGVYWPPNEQDKHLSREEMESHVARLQNRVYEDLAGVAGVSVLSVQAGCVKMISSIGPMNLNPTRHRSAADRLGDRLGGLDEIGWHDE